MADGINILLVEDNPGDARLLIETLREGNDLTFKVQEATTFEGAIERAAEQTPDIVLLDLNLPDSHGLYTFLRFRQTYASIPVVVLTGIDDEELGIQAVKEGAEDFLTKGDLSPRLLGRAVRYAIERNELKSQLEYFASHDALTGVLNRRYFNQMIGQELARSTRYKHPIGFLIVDIDSFKQINDTHGHDLGDRVLQGVARFLVRQMRTVDIVIRYGGDEFLLVLPETGKDSDLAAQRVRDAAARELASYVPSLDCGISISIGASYWSPDRDVTIEQALSEADQDMYGHKERANA